jgi:hypothetical protein
MTTMKFTPRIGAIFPSQDAPGIVTDMSTYRRETPSVEQQARDQVAEQLNGRVTFTILCQAKARAVRSVIGGRPLRKAVDYAVSWALSANHGDEPPGVA